MVDVVEFPYEFSKGEYMKMECLRCKAEMKHYKLNKDFGIYGKVHDPGNGYAKCQSPHNPHSIYVCDECGYMELSSKTCENEDI